MMGLTRRQRACLEAVRAYHAQTGMMPTLDELRVVLGLASRGAASQLLARLAERGAIERWAGRPRAIAIARCPHCGGELQARGAR